MSFICQDRFTEPVAQATGRQARRARRRFFPVRTRRQGAVVGMLLAVLLCPAAVAEEGFVSLMPKKDITGTVDDRSGAGFHLGAQRRHDLLRR